MHLSGNIFFLDDLKIFYYPLEEAYATYQKTGSLPLWNTEFGFGHPLLAWGQLGFFTPLHVLLRLLGVPALILLQISVAAYFLVGLVGMFAFFRARRFPQRSSALAGLIFVFCGFSIGHLNHVNFYTGTMLLPWLLLALEYFRTRPTIRKSVVVAAVAAAIALSSQPQITLFVFIIAGLVTAILAAFEWKNIAWKWFVPYIFLAGIIGAGVASLSILPLLEFLPQTERATSLDASELFAFSYPPHHAVTLLLPYFYGGHNDYWGSRGFQELAAFVGLIPLALAFSALFFWKTRKPERAIGALFILIAIIFSLGKYSVIYQYLVEQHFVTSMGVASRFVFFFDVGVLFLAAVSLEDIIHRIKSRRSLIAPILPGLALTVAMLVPFIQTLAPNTREFDKLVFLWEKADGLLLLVIATTVGLLITPLLYKWDRVTKYIPLSLVVVTGISLLAYSWNYNPHIPTSIAFKQSPLIETLKTYRQETGLPARLYARPNLIQSPVSDSDAPKYTDAISPDFSVFQPIPAPAEQSFCVGVPFEAKEDPTIGSVTVGLHTNPFDPPLQTQSVQGYLVGYGSTQEVCFDRVSDNTHWLSFTAQEQTNIVVAMRPQAESDQQVYLLRKPEPTEKEWARSQKEFQLSLVIQDASDMSIDDEAAHLARHLNVIGDASSARWIGALSIREYRNFVEFFFANDSEPIDGDNVHAIERYRTIANMVGITHLAQLLPEGVPDGMEDANFKLISTSPVGTRKLRIYENPEAFPKTFMVPRAVWKPAEDEIRDALRKEDYDPRQFAYLSGPKPIEGIPTENTGENIPLEYITTITEYGQTRITVETEADKDAYLILTDSTTPQWQTYIDGEPAERLVGNSIFKAAHVPAGKHTVVFQYESPATTMAARFTLASLLVAIVCVLAPSYKRLVVRK